MKKNIQSLLKRDLELIPLIAYFVFFFLYLFFEVVLNQKEYAALVKPVILPIIGFLYIIHKNSKRTILNLILLIFIFISDNSDLLEMRSLYIYAVLLNLLSLYILFFYSILDVKCIKNTNKTTNIVGIVLISLLLINFIYFGFNYNFKEKLAEKYIVFDYLIIFGLLFILSIFNYMQQKTLNTKFLFLTLLFMFLSNLFFSIDMYYSGNEVFKYLVGFAEIPIYYFLLKYLLKRDKELTEQ